MFMMTSAVMEFAARGVKHLYLGTCYSERALYKTQFAGVEFFNGLRWSQDLEELKFIIQRDNGKQTPHLLETEEYCEQFYAGEFRRMAGASALSVRLRND
jgi:hypothetical protein